jgi:hypothetical protein
MFAPVELPKRAKLPTEPDFERRAVTSPDQVQKPEARVGGARLLLGGGGPDNWQRWGGKPEFEKVWQMQQPALPKDTRESHGGTARRLAGGKLCFQQQEQQQHQQRQQQRMPGRCIMMLHINTNAAALLSCHELHTWLYLTCAFNMAMLHSTTCQKQLIMRQRPSICDSRSTVITAALLLLLLLLLAHQQVMWVGLQPTQFLPATSEAG